MLLKKIFLFIFFIFTFPFPIFAESPVFDLEGIVVSKQERDGFALPSRTEVSSQDIEIKNAQTVDEALDFLSGVRLTVGQKNEPYVMLRGFNQDKILILLDGIPIASPAYGYVDLDQIPVENIAMIDVIKGDVSPLYGANTLGGVINIVTRRATEKPVLELDTGFSANDTQRYILNYGKKFRDLNIWISASHRESDGFELSNDFKANRNEEGGFRDNSFYEKQAFSLKFGFEKNKKHNIAALFDYIDNEKGIPPSVSSTRPRFWRFTEWKRWIFAPTIESKITDNLSIKTRIFYDKYDNTLKSYDNATYTTQNNSSSWTSIYDDYALGSSIYFTFNPKNKHFLKGAINFKKDVHKEQDDKDEPWETYEAQTYSAGLEDDIEINQKLSLSTGASFGWFNQKRTATGEKGDDVLSFNPIFTINYKLGPNTLLYSSVSRRTQFPAMNQLFSNTSGNPHLNEQRNINYEFGIKHNFNESMSLEADYFYNNVKDLIDRASKDDPYLNISKVIFEGVETTFNAKIGKFLSARLGYTYLDARDKNPGLFGRSEDELSYIPEHKADFEIGYLSDFGFSCDLLGSYNGKRYYYDSSNMQHALGGYSVWNGRVSQKFLKYWQGSISVENILDKNYQEEEGFPQPGRTFLFSIKGVF